MTAFVSDQALVVASRSGDMRATEELVRRYAWLARREATRFYVDGCTRDDLVQEGMLGVLAAIDRYELDRGAPFNDLAATVVRRRIIDRWRREKAPNRLTFKQIDNAVQKARRTLRRAA